MWYTRQGHSPRAAFDVFLHHLPEKLKGESARLSGMQAARLCEGGRCYIDQWLQHQTYEFQSGI
jgi:hypothetical protein